MLWEVDLWSTARFGYGLLDNRRSLVTSNPKVATLPILDI